jgi:hypothetical protein
VERDKVIWEKRKTCPTVSVNNKVQEVKGRKKSNGL